MKKQTLALVAASLLGALPLIASAEEPKSDWTVAGNAGLFSDYRFRGISQTNKKPAFQGGIDISHSSGFYVGNWNSNVDSGLYNGANIEMDFYGGYKLPVGPVTLDFGALYYYYPGSGAGGSFKIDNTELYVGASYGAFSLKYSHAISDYFSLPDTKGSHYWDLSANYDLGGGWGLVGHVGNFKLKGWSTGTDATNGNYTDWKVGVTKDISGWVFGASYIDTTAKGSCNLANPGFYCFANQLPAGAGSKFKDAGRGILVLSVSKTF